MDLLARAKVDLDRVLQAEWGVAITIAPTAVALPTSIIGLATKHHMAIDPTTGMTVNVKNVHISVSERTLAAKPYTVRNASGEVALKNHLVKFADSSGVIKNYIVDECYPDETLGLITLILGDAS